MRYVLTFLLTGLLLSTNIVAIACDVCQSQQPRALRGLAHGAGPESDWDYVIVGSTALIALVSLVYAIRWTIRPGERDKAHIKYSIFNRIES